MPFTTNRSPRATSAPCPWRFQRGSSLWWCDSSEEGHLIHLSLAPPGISWREDEPGAFRVEPGQVPAPSQVPKIRSTPVDHCDNRQCPNQATEGLTMITTVFATHLGGKRDITLLLCAPCAEYLGQALRQ